MPRVKPCKRRDFIRKLRQLGFALPEAGGRHGYMRHGRYTLTLPNNYEYSVPQVKMLLKEMERGLRRKISMEEWQAL
jgi:predicted RNA binding protein YcfA (HicA-like mRNA interferase family)